MGRTSRQPEKWFIHVTISQLLIHPAHLDQTLAVSPFQLAISGQHGYFELLIPLFTLTINALTGILRTLIHFKLNRSTDFDFWHRFAVFPYRAEERFAGLTAFVPQPRCPVLANRRLKSCHSLLPDLLWLGGSCDPYLEIERYERLTRRLLEVIASHCCPVVIITSSALILRDIDLLGEIAEAASVTVALMLPYRMACSHWEEDPESQNRLEALLRLKRIGLRVGLGVELTGVDIREVSENLRPLFKWSQENSSDFLHFSELAFRPSTIHFLPSKESVNPGEDLLRRRLLSQAALTLAQEFNISLRIPRPEHPGILRENKWLASRLADAAFYRRLEGKSSQPWLKVARYLDRLDGDVRNLLQYDKVEDLPWVDARVAPSFADLVGGVWSGRRIPWQWLGTI